MEVMVAKQAKKNSGEKPEVGKPEKAVKPVRLRPSFHRKLKRVAEDADRDIGEFIEGRLSEFVEREYRRIVLQEAKSVQEEE